MHPDDRAPFDLNTPFHQVPALGSLLLNLTQRALAFERLANIHRQAGAQATSPADFAAQALEFLQVRFQLDERHWRASRRFAKCCCPSMRLAGRVRRGRMPEHCAARFVTCVTEVCG